jgi:hypothetical protein
LSTANLFAAGVLLPQTGKNKKNKKLSPEHRKPVCGRGSPASVFAALRRRY